MRIHEIRGASLIAPLVAACVVGCGGGAPTIATVERARHGATPAQIRAAFGEPSDREQLPAPTDGPTRERWVYPARAVLGDGTGHVAIEFVADHEDRMYPLDDEQYRQAFGATSVDDAVDQLRARRTP